MEFVTKSSQDTKSLGKEIASDLTISTKNKEHSAKGATTLALTGDLGSGKTTFVQGLAEGLGIKQRILSPTFILMRKYEIRDTKDEKHIASHVSRFTNFYHIDLYRLEGNIESELKNLGVDEIWKDSSNIVAVEWAEKAKEVIPKHAKWIKFENLGKDKRRIVINH